MATAVALLLLANNYSYSALC